MTALANGLSALSLACLTTLSLDIDVVEPLNHSFQPGSLHDPSSPTTDSLCRALHRLASTQLVSLRLGGPFIVSPALFTGTSSDDADDDGKDWPTLRYLTIEASALTPDGKWYFTGDPSDTREFAVFNIGSLPLR